MWRTSRSVRFLAAVGGASMAIALGSPVRLAAQAMLAELSEAGTASNFGNSIAGMGDIDGDGHADFVTSASGGGASGAGVVRIYSGADFSVLREWSGDATGDQFGQCVDNAGDVDGDGLDDVIVGAPLVAVAGDEAGLVRVFSSASGALLYDIPGLAAELLGSVVAGVGDLDGDGHADFATSSSVAFSLGDGYVRIFSGADGHEFVRIQGQADQYLGANVRPAGDFDHDGRPDVAVTTGFSFLDPYTQHVLVYSGAWIVSGTQPTLLLDLTDSTLSEAVDAAGDLNHDGWDDLLVGTPNAGDVFPKKGGWRVISGRDHSVLLNWIASSPYQTVGTKVAGAGDLDHDGFRDLLVGGSDYSVVFGNWLGMAFSGRDGALLFTCQPPPVVQGQLSSLADVGDLNADGFTDWAMGTPWIGTIWLYSPAGLWDDLGHGLAGGAGVPVLSGTGLLLGGDPIDVTLAGALPGQPFVLVIGTSATNLPFQGGVLVPHADLLLFDVTDAGGGRLWSDSWPLGVPAMSFYFQVWLQDPSAVKGWAASNGLRAQSP